MQAVFFSIGPLNLQLQRIFGRMTMRLVLCLGLVASLLTACGGEEGPPEYTVKGTVNFDGKPLETGSIVFEDVEGKTASAGGGIEDGAYEFQSPPGKKKVKITASRTTEETDEYGEPISESYIPDKYNSKTTLEFEVEPNDENVKDWNLDKQ